MNRLGMLVTLGIMLGLVCGGCAIEVDVPSDGGSAITAPLDQANATITIEGLASTGQATVTARLTDSRGRLIELGSGQAVFVAGQQLTGPNLNGDYVATIGAAGEYIIEASEPSLGIQSTTVSAPPGFLILTPEPQDTASLAGFTMTWDGANPNLTVMINLRQNVFGQDRERSFGPFADTGTQTFGADNLSGFQQGAPLVAEVVKSTTRSSLNGFQSATVESTFTQSVLVNPGP